MPRIQAIRGIVKIFWPPASSVQSFHHVRVAYAGERRARFRSFFVKHGQKLFPIFDLRRLKRRPADRRVIEFLRVDGHGRPPGSVRDVRGIPAHRSGLLVRLPVPLFIGHALERLCACSAFPDRIPAASIGQWSWFRPPVRKYGLTSARNHRRTKGEMSTLSFVTLIACIVITRSRSSKPVPRASCR